MRHVFLSVALFASTVLGISCDQEEASGLPGYAYCVKRWTQTIHIDNRVDVIFIIDNSGSMAGKQAQLIGAVSRFVDDIKNRFGNENFHIAVLTTGIKSDECPDCSGAVVDSCINETGESGKYQDRIGNITWSGDEPIFDHTSDVACRVVTSDRIDCLYDEVEERGTALVGVSGCRYRRGLAAMKRALQPLLNGAYNAGFYRQDIPLAVVLISDGEDCGEPGDVAEGIPGVDERICSYAAKGVGPDGGGFHPQDPDSKPYRLTPVEDYYNFLMDLKDNRTGMVKFAAIVGVTDVEDPLGTTIDYESTDPSAAVLPACTVPGCTGENCEALPATRAIQLAQMFGIGNNGYVDTICKEDFSNSMVQLGNFVCCPNSLKLSEKPLDPELIGILINEEPLPLYSCSIPDRFEECSGPGDTTCSEGSCVPTWDYCVPGYPSPRCDHLDFTNAPGGIIVFADHFNICDPEGEHPIYRRIDLVYATDCD
jgi:hypothetical protein